MRHILAVLFFLSTVSVQAEYRVYVLELTNTETQEVRTIHSTLEPTAYQTIYPLQAHEKITAVNSWKCKGNTGEFKILCSP